MLRYLTAGESHGKGMSAILEGIPANLVLDTEKINYDLARRQRGYGRGGRMKIESDTVEILSGVRGYITTGAPIAVFIKNKDYENWKDIIGCEAAELDKRVVTKLRPGHADYSGTIKYNQTDARNILERASARETAARVAVGSICRQFLEQIGITVGSHVINVAGINSNAKASSASELIKKAGESELGCLDKTAETEMKKTIDFAAANGDTAGGIIECIASGMPVGVGSHIQYDKKLDYMLSGHIASVQAVKSVEIGMGKDCADFYGSKVHDEMIIENGKMIRKTNNAGGIEGGMSNGENIVVRAAVKPIPTLMKGLKSVDLITRKQVTAEAERSDICAVPAAGVVIESVMCFVLSYAILDTFGGDYMDEVKERVSLRRERSEW